MTINTRTSATTARTVVMSSFTGKLNYKWGFVVLVIFTGSSNICDLVRNPLQNASCMCQRTERRNENVTQERPSSMNHYWTLLYYDPNHWGVIGTLCHCPCMCRRGFCAPTTRSQSKRKASSLPGLLGVLSILLGVAL